MSDLTRPIIGIENRTAQEVFDIMCDRFRAAERALAERAGGVKETATAVANVLAERRRQIDEEGWTPEHDDQHRKGELLLAAKAYFSHALGRAHSFPSSYAVRPGVPFIWPWEARWWKPKSPREDLIRAGALARAEIDRVQRNVIEEAIPRWSLDAEVYYNTIIAELAHLDQAALTTEPAAPEGRQEDDRIRREMDEILRKQSERDIPFAPSTRPAEQAVTEAMVEALRNIDAEAPAKEPRDDWTSTDLDEAFYEGKLRGFWEMAVYAREALTAALGAQTPPEGAVTEAMVEAAAPFHDHWCGEGTIGAANARRNTREILSAALKAAMEAGRHD